MTATGPEKFRLNVLGADEDVPRLLLAYGRGCGGEVAFVMRPRDNTALLVHQVKKEPAKVWRTDLGLAPSHAPELDADPAAAVAEIRKMKLAPPPAGPATLKGKWAGLLVCDDGTPRMALERKVASYGTLKLTSKADGRWTATFDRAGKWFSQAKQETVERSGLAEAITAGMGLVVGLVSEACSFRDTHRRNTVDAEFAAQHPYTPPKEPKDPTGRYKPKSSFRAFQVENGWAVVNDVGATVAMFGAKEKGKATKHASALTRGKTPAATAPAAPSLESIPAPEPPSCPTSVARIASATTKEAEALEELAGGLEYQPGGIRALAAVAPIMPEKGEPAECAVAHVRQHEVMRMPLPRTNQERVMTNPRPLTLGDVAAEHGVSVTEAAQALAP